MPHPYVPGHEHPPRHQGLTWVLDRACPDCGVDVSGLRPDDIPSALRAAVGRWVEVLTDPSLDLGQRPSPQVWSVTEYAAHVRDVFRRFAERVALMEAEDDPVFEILTLARYLVHDPEHHLWDVTGHRPLARP